MNLTIRSEGMIWKQRAADGPALIAFKGHSLPLGYGEILHAMQVGASRFAPDAHGRLTCSQDYGRTWSEPVTLRWPGRAAPTPTSMMFSLGNDNQLRAVVTGDQNVAPDDPRWRKENGGWVGTDQYACESTDHGQSWPTVTPIRTSPAKGGFNVVSSPVFARSSGERMVVIEPMISGDLSALDHEAAVVFNRDGGEQWGDKGITDSRRVW